ncbi:MAG: serine hydroxymethyltransferase, partial [Deltaproteobacteria bacterium]
MCHLEKDDPEIAVLVKKEEERIENTLDLIAAENHSPRSIMEVLGSVLNTKTIEGYPGKRFHAGCTHVDEIENLAVTRGKALFGAEHINVQPHSGTSANLAVFFSVLDVGDRILAMGLPYGGHLSHGHRASITSKCFNFFHYS